MPSRIAVIAIDAVNPRLVAEFRCNVLEWHVVDEDDEGVISIAQLDGGCPTIDVVGVVERKLSRTGCSSTCAPTAWPHRTSSSAC